MALTQSPVVKAFTVSGTLTSPQTETSILAGRGTVTFVNDSAETIYWTNSASAAGNDWYPLYVYNEFVWAIDTGSVVTFYFACASGNATYLRRMETK
jgi:hypothetical protein